MSTWLKFHKIGDAKEMTTFLLEQAKQREDQWLTVPGLNLPHNCDYPIPKIKQAIQESTQTLEKRKATLESKLADIKTENENLKRQLANERQLRADDKMRFDLILIRLKQEGRLLPPPEESLQPCPHTKKRPKGRDGDSHN